MANYDDDRDNFRDPYGPVDPVDPAARRSEPVIDPNPRPVYASEASGSRSAAALIPILVLALVIAGAWWLMRSAPEQRGTDTAMGTAGYETTPDAGPEAGVPGVVGRPGVAGTSGMGDGLVGVQAGDDVHLHDARITDVAGERTFWISAGAGERMLVLAPHTTGVTGQVGDRREGFRAGQTVAIEGRAENAADVSMEGLTDADRNALESAEGLMIRAIRVTGL